MVDVDIWKPLKGKDASCVHSFKIERQIMPNFTLILQLALPERPRDAFHNTGSKLKVG